MNRLINRQSIDSMRIPFAGHHALIRKTVADTRHDACWTVHASSPFDAIARADPYLIWADATHYRDFAHAFDGRIPIAIELKQGASTAQTFARLIEKRGWDDWIWMSALYRDAPAALGATRFCTAQITRRFFTRMTDELAGLIERFTLAVPIGASRPRDVRRVNMSHEPIAPAVERDDIGRVIVGVCDDEIAFSHRRFFEDASGTRTRFQSFWIQDDETNSAAGLGYGSELLKAQMDDDLRRANRLKQASDAEGVYRIADYAGLAHHADAAHFDDAPHLTPLPLIGVQFGHARGALRDAAGLRLDVQALDAVRYIVKRAQDTCGSACHALVNMSYGQLSGPRDGSSLIESALDELMDTGTCSIVMPAGNRHLSHCHGAVSIADETPLRWRVPHDSNSPSFVEIWFPANESEPSVDVRIVPPEGIECTPSAWIRRGEHATLSDHGDTLCTVVHHGRGARGDGHMILIAVTPVSTRRTSRKDAAPGDWFIHLKSRGPAKANAVYYCTRRASVCRVAHPRA